jgi:hypothetical protein
MTRRDAAAGLPGCTFPVIIGARVTPSSPAPPDERLEDATRGCGSPSG